MAPCRLDTPLQIIHQLDPHLPLDLCLLPRAFLDYHLKTQGEKSLSRRNEKVQRRVVLYFFLAYVVAICLTVRQRIVAAQTTPVAKEKPVDFDREIRPILSDTCFTCHGPDEKARVSGLRLDTKEGAFADRGGYRVIVPEKSGESKLYQRISSQDPAVRMPPAWSGRNLTTKQIDLFRRWIDEGAKWETHWAYVPPTRPPMPEVQHKSWPKNPIDYFILSRLEQEGLKPSPEADKVTLMRRVTFDLTGLPPTPAEVDTFLADQSPNAYEKVVDRLLKSPHYGERMAMEWLDLARYADTHGYHIDSQREMWHWRDWVINAFNRNMPFDEFTIEQLAGDLLSNATIQQKIASGFHRNHMINYEGGAIPEEYQNEYVVDRVDATATVWMGTTLGCARCHDHKYDPFKQKDFYRFYAFFNDVPEKGLDGQMGNAQPVVQIPTAEQQHQLDELTRRIADLKVAMPEKQVEGLESEWQKTALSSISEAPRNGLIAHYEMEGNLVDSAGKNPPASTQRGQVTFDDGAVGKAGEFNGETDVEFGNAGDFERTETFAIALWFNQAGALDKISRTLVQKVDGSKDRTGYEFFFDELTPVGDLKLGSHLFARLTHRWPDDAIQIRTRERFSQAFYTGGGHHLVLNHDGSGKASGLKLYLDGKLQEVEVTQDSLKGSIRTAAPLEIGNKKKGEPFKGQIDDLRIYNRGLSDSEIEQLAVHEPIRAILSPASTTCAEMASVLEKDKLSESEKDPLAEQAQQDSKEYGIKARCQFERDRLRDYFLTWAAPDRFKKPYAELKDVEKQEAQLDKVVPTSMVMSEMKKPRETFVLARGDYRNKGEKVSPGVPAVLPPLPKDAPLDRLGLAKWLVSPSHPLTARVAANHFWQLYFGTGLVKTAENFGAQGEPPSHPELFDWLATEFIRTGWDVKAMQRLIVTSATYRQSSRTTQELLEKDPENRLLAHGPRLRLPAEVVRDNALAVSGLLNPEIGGPSVFPYQPKGLWEEMAIGLVFSAQSYTPSHGKDLYRRSMYTFWKRTVPPPSLATFDAPDREKCTARRLPTNTPLQALVLMNDPTYVEAARALAERAIIEAGRDPAQRISYAFRLATARKPGPEELKVLSELARQELARYDRDREAALKLLGVGESPFDKKVDVSELAAWTTVASAILNLDETITKE